MKNITKTNHEPRRTDLAQNDIARQMLQVWSCAMSVDSTLDITEKRKTTLNLLFAQVFQYNLGRWEQFVDLIGGSELLQTKLCKHGELFDWAIRPWNCLMILDRAETTGSITDELVESLIAEQE